MRREFANVEEVIAALAPSYPVYCLRPEVLAANARRFMATFPGRILYAVKCNPHPFVLDALHAAGIGAFDTASLPEIALIAERFRDARSYFMHPVKSRAAIQAACSVYGVRDYVVDHRNELGKLLAETGTRDLTVFVRLRTPTDPTTVYDLSSKFGCDVATASALLHDIRAAGCRPALAFHVGSQCGTPDSYRQALGIVGETIAASGIVPVAVDVGGGFPAEYATEPVPPLEDYMAVIREGLASLALPAEVEFLAEPGRALVANACSLVVQIQLRKEDALYINDGMFGSLSEMALSRLRMPMRLIRQDGEPSARDAPFKLYGPTCDSLDVLPGTFALPEDAREGDWIEIDQLGAYSNALATHFNGFFPETMVRVFDRTPSALHSSSSEE